MTTLNDPLQLPCGVRLPNRILKSAMSEALGRRDHSPSDDLLHLYEVWGAGGPALLVTGNVMVDHEHLGEPGNVVITDGRDLPRLKQWAANAKRGGAHVWVQLNHPGRQTPAFLTPAPVGPSPVPLTIPGFAPPRAMTAEDIRSTIAAFGKAAGVCKEAGFDGVQIHGAHGYLVAQFLSPATNQRSDEWGGSPDRRRRFLQEVLAAIRAAVGPEFPVGIKLNSSDFQTGGFSEEESLAVIKCLADWGIDHIEISGGSYEKPAMMVGRSQAKNKQQAFFLDFAAKAKEVTSVPIAVTGGFRRATAMAAAVASGKTDMVGLARPFVLHPHLAQTLAQHQHGHHQSRGTSDVTFAVPEYLTTGFKKLDQAVMIGLTWYTRQIHHLAAGRRPNPELHPLKAILGLMVSAGWQNLRRVRAKN